MAAETPAKDPQSTIWEHLNAGFDSDPSFSWKQKTTELYGPLHENPDMISMREVSGIEVFRKQAAPDTYSSVALTTESAREWLRAESDAGEVTERPSLRVLIGSQVMKNDLLRPPLSLSETHISKSLLADCLGIPVTAADKLGQELSYTVEYPPMLATAQGIKRYALVSGPFSVAWSYNPTTGQTRAFIVVRGSASSYKRRDRMCNVLKSLHAFSNLSGFLPFVILDSMVDYAASAALHNQRGSEDDNVQVSRWLQQVESVSNLFLGVTSRVANVSAVLRHSNSTLDMCKRIDISQPQRPGHSTDDEWRELQAHHEWLQKAIEFRRQELESLINHARDLKERSDALLSTAMGVMTFNQQSAAQEMSTAMAGDSKVMKEIATETKKDSTSMKILALMTMIFLPSTAISAIMAIPGIFDFSGHPGAALVNSRFWIFFAVALPLTLATMLFTWCWLRWENLGRPVWWVEWRGRGGLVGGGGDGDGDGDGDGLSSGTTGKGGADIGKIV